MLEKIKNNRKLLIAIGSVVCVSIIGIMLIKGFSSSKAEETEPPITEVTTIATEPISEPVTEAITSVVAEPEVIIEEPIGPTSHLTGLPILQEYYDHRPIGIMISNIKAALPQYGVYDADIIYETIVEGGITRLFAVYQDFETEKIGPIRSSRHYYLDFALDHDAIYVHFGQSTYATAAFKKLDVDRFNGLSGIETILTFRDPDRKAPHSTFTDKEHLMATWDKVGYEVATDYENNKFEFNEEIKSSEEGRTLTKLILDYSYYIKPELVYNEEDGLYYRFQFDKEHIDANNNEQLSFTNIIVQYASIWLIKGDTLGCLDMNIIAKGEGMYITQGKMVPITWEKTDHYRPTKYFLEDGSPLLLNPGKTFVSVFPTNRIDKIIME